MPFFTDFKSFKSDGTVPDSVVPATTFQLTHYSYLWIYFSSDAAGAAAAFVGSLGGFAVPMTGLSSKTVIQEFILEIQRGGAAVFRLHATWETDLLALVEDAGWGTLLAVYTYRFVEVSSHAVVEFPVPPPDTLGTAQITAIPGGGGGFTNAVAEIQDELRMPAYELSLLPGDKLKVIFHSSGEPELRRSNENFQIRTLLGGGVEFIRHPENGLNYFIYYGHGALRCHRSFERGGFITSDADAVISTSSGISRFSATRTGCTPDVVWQDATGVRLAWSEDFGATWKVQTTVFPGIEPLARHCVSADRSSLYLFGKAKAADVDKGIAAGDLIRLVARWDAVAGVRQWVESARSKITVTATSGALPTSGALYDLALSGTTFDLACNVGSGVRMFVSSDELSSLAESA